MAGISGCFGPDVISNTGFQEARGKTYTDTHTHTCRPAAACACTPLTHFRIKTHRLYYQTDQINEFQYA